MSDQTIQRKDAHLELCASAEVEPPGADPLFGEVELIHECLPELSVAEIDLSCRFLGKRLRAPVLVGAMTGGTARAGSLNRGLARLAEELGIGFGVGSQRAMLERPEAAASFQVRDAAPTTALLGNIGLWQARESGPKAVRRLMEGIGADGIAVHLNAAQELIQPEGDRDFGHGIETIETLASELGEKLVVKETGCGIRPRAALLLAQIGVGTIDLAGAGGTSWAQVEALRAEGRARSLGKLFAGWGIPTAAAVASVSHQLGGRASIIASGGIRDGLMAAKALALGADLVGVALPVLQAWERGGEAAARDFLEELIEGLRIAMALTGARTIGELRARPLVIKDGLQAWITALERGVG
jgi:isopentenyl-diphosphate delta-isomerase